MSIANFVFWAIMIIIAASALMVVAARNILHAAFSLCLTFLGVGAMYIFLHADFVAAVQLIVYVGGILVLIMFAVMFSSNVTEDSAEKGRGKLGMIVGAVGALALFAALYLLTQRLQAPLAAANRFAQAEFQNTISVDTGQTGLGHYLMGQYLLPFEVVSVLLLAALIGAVVIVRKELKS